MKEYGGSLEIYTGIFCDGKRDCPVYEQIQHAEVDWVGLGMGSAVEGYDTVDEPFDQCRSDQPHSNRQKRMIAVEPIPCTNKVRRIGYVYVQMVFLVFPYTSVLHLL